MIKDAEASLGKAHVGTFNKIGQHAYVYIRNFYFEEFNS